jgi:hypothetical protein
MLFREVNERMRWLHTELEHEGELQIICECRNCGCLEPLSLSAASYDAIRRIPTHFIVKAGHEMPDGERVAATFNGYVVAEKTGQAARTQSASTRASDHPIGRTLPSSTRLTSFATQKTFAGLHRRAAGPHSG